MKTVPLAVRPCIMHDGVPAHFSRPLRDALFNTYYRWIHSAEPVAGPTRSLDLSPLDFYPGTLKNPSVPSPNKNKETLHQYI